MTFSIITVMLTSSSNMQIYFPCLDYTFQERKIFLHITGRRKYYDLIITEKCIITHTCIFFKRYFK